MNRFMLVNRSGTLVCQENTHKKVCQRAEESTQRAPML